MEIVVQLSTMFSILIDISNLQLQYKKRYEILKKIVNSKLIEITPTYIVNSKEDINKYYLQFVEKGEEGSNGA